jgi:hypothetical protein
MSNQPAMQALIAKHPTYFRLLPTPIAEQAANDTAYIAHNVFLGTEADMEDIAVGIRKVQQHYAARATQLATEMAVGVPSRR